MKGSTVFRMATLIALLFMCLEAGEIISTITSDMQECSPLIYDISIFSELAYAENRRPDRLAENEYLENISLFGEISQKDKDYLGIAEGEPTLCNMSGGLVLVQLFSIYCPHCQRLAPTFNRLYALIENDSVCRKNLRMIGIGIGNNDREVEYYREFYKVPFPVFTDPDFRIHKILHEPRTPFLFLCRTGVKRSKIVAILDSTDSPEDQLTFLKATLDRASGSFKEQGENPDEIMEITKGCQLYDAPNGKAFVCLVKGTKVKKLETDGNWCNIETLAHGIRLHGWLRIK